MQAPKRPSLLPMPEPQTEVNSSVVGLILRDSAAAHSQWCSWRRRLPVEDSQILRPGDDNPGYGCGPPSGP